MMEGWIWWDYTTVTLQRETDTYSVYVKGEDLPRATGLSSKEVTPKRREIELAEQNRRNPKCPKCGKTIQSSSHAC